VGKLKRKRPAPDAPQQDVASPTKKQVYSAAKGYRKAGFSFLPIRADGTKSPAFELLPRVWCPEEFRRKAQWRCFKERRPTREEIKRWYVTDYPEREYGMAVLGGAVSGNLEIIDLDNWGVVAPWMKLVEEKAPGLLKRLVRVKTPRPGMHVYYRCATIGGNEKLARVPDTEHDNEKPKTIIELKGEGGYCLAPPSPARCHKSRRCYAFLDGKDLTMVPTITEEERQVMLDCARALNEWEDKKPKTYVPAPRRVSAGAGDLPGDDFNRRADWGDILLPHGWKWQGRSGGVDLWCRPGKKRGTSATTNYAESDLLHNFSANAEPFEEETSYTKFHAYALLEHEGNFTAAASALRRLGYGGEGRARGGRPRDPSDRYAGYKTRSRPASPARRPR
jgi:putative DNA primase/helicase